LLHLHRICSKISPFGLSQAKRAGGIHALGNDPVRPKATHQEADQRGPIRAKEQMLGQVMGFAPLDPSYALGDIRS
jgi:hypothetical protein